MEEGVRLAGTVEIGGLDLPMNEERAYVLLRQAKAMLPGLETSDYSIWMGFRPSFPDSLPVIDEAPGLRGLFLAFGHGHTGMTGGAPTGRLVNQLLTGEPSDVPLAPYSAKSAPSASDTSSSVRPYSEAALRTKSRAFAPFSSAI